MYNWCGLWVEEIGWGMITETENWASAVQFDPLLEAGYEGTDVLRAAIDAPNLRPVASRQVGLRIAMPGSEVGVLGALGAEYLPDQSGQLLVLVVVSDRGVHSWHEDGICALPAPFGEYVLDGVLRAPGVKNIGAGVLRFDRALLTPGSSSAAMFTWLGTAVAQVIAAGEAIPTGEALSHLLGDTEPLPEAIELAAPPEELSAEEQLPVMIRPAPLKRWRPPRANRPRMWIGTHSVPQGIDYHDDDLPGWLSHDRQADIEAEIEEEPIERAPRANGWIEPDPDLDWLPGEFDRSLPEPALLPAAGPTPPDDPLEGWEAAPQWAVEDPDWLSEAIEFDAPTEPDHDATPPVPAADVLPALGVLPAERFTAPPVEPATFMTDEELDDFLQAPLDFALGKRGRGASARSLRPASAEDSRYELPPPATDAEDEDPREATYLCASCGRYAAEWLKPGLYRCTHCGAMVEYDIDTAVPPHRRPDRP